jgi:hypothetical protein
MVGALPVRAASVALFFNASYVDTATDGSGEAYNVQQALLGQGHTVTTFTGVTANELAAALAGKDALVIPELQNGNLSPDLSNEAAFTIALFVNTGGTLLVFDPAVGDPLAVLNGAFPQFHLTSSGVAVGTISKAAGASGTPFVNGPPTLPANLNAVDTVLASSLPNGNGFSSKGIYTDSNGNAAVASISFGGGNIVIMGWDWFDAQPVGAQDGGWLAVLDTAAAITGLTGIPTLSEWAMIAMAALLIALGLFALRRPRPAGA